MADQEETSGASSGGPEADFVLRLRSRYLASVNRKIDALCLLLAHLAARTDPDFARSDALLNADPLAPLPTVERPTADPPATGEDGGETPLTRAVRIAHSMAGSGASYGFPGITERSRPMEARLKRLPESPDEKSDALLDVLADALWLRADLRRARDGDTALMTPGNGSQGSGIWEAREGSG